MTVTQVLGAKVQPTVAKPIEWNDTRTYEPLTYVMHEGDTYITDRYVPVGIALDDEAYWTRCASFSGQIEGYREEIKTLKERVFKSAIIVNDVAALKQLNVQVGDFVFVKSLNAVFDIVADGIESYTTYKVNDLYANFHSLDGNVTLTQLGYTDVTVDASSYIKYGINYSNETKLKFIIDKSCTCLTPITFTENLVFATIENASNYSIKYYGEGFFITFGVTQFIKINGLRITGNGSNSFFKFTDSAVSNEINDCMFYNFVEALHFSTIAYTYIRRCQFNPAAQFTAALTIGDSTNKTVELLYVQECIFDGWKYLYNNDYPEGNFIQLSHGSTIHFVDCDMANIHGDIFNITQLTSNGINGFVCERCSLTRCHHVLNVTETLTNYNRGISFVNCEISLGKAYVKDDCSFKFNVTNNYTSISGFAIKNVLVTSIDYFTNAYEIIKSNKVIQLMEEISYNFSTPLSNTPATSYKNVSLIKGNLDNIVKPASGVTLNRGYLYNDCIVITDFTITNTINAYSTLFTISGHNFFERTFVANANKLMYCEGETIKTRDQFPEGTYFCNIVIPLSN